MSRYRCNSCQTTFDHAGGPLRCPDCLRQNALEPIELPVKRPARKRSETRGRRLLWPSLIGLATVAVVGGVLLLLWRRQVEVPRPGELGPLGPDLLRRALIARGVAPENAIDPFTADLSHLVEGTDQGDPAARARAVAQKLAVKIAGISVPLSEPPTWAIRTAAETARAIAAGRLERATSLELSLVLLAALREAGLNAVLCETHRIDAPMRSADPSAVLGRYLVAVYPEDALGRKTLVVFDPARATALPEWNGGGKDPSMAAKAKEHVPLDDASGAAHLLSLRAVAAMERDAEKHAARAYAQTQQALAAAMPSATLLARRALVLAAAGGTRDALAAAQRALARRDDPPRRALVARLLLAINRGRDADALIHLERAVKQDGFFWPARLMLATLRWSLGDRPRGDEALAAAVKVAAEEPAVLAARASREVIEGRVDEAIELLQRATRGRAAEGLLLQLYLLLRRADRADEATAVRERLLRSSRNPEKMKRLLQGMTGRAATSRPAIELPDVSLTP